ncbi:hypothetical protein QVD17_18125 [Tagetes erecta]|uniref:TF-B3 domain-containing protein n=1 Tax=Tagetes erecta TaxID=13708 RepID=A0AAD8NW25_TARER|nr:hypothetical protein QVD17_18125 [Tagetes erecta]
MDHQMQKQSPHHGDAEFWPLSGNPYFYVVMDKSKRFQLNFPPELSDKLPATKVLAQVIYREKAWNLLYIGDQATKCFGIASWRRFMTANNLKAGDACLFELMEVSSNRHIVKFKVQIFKDDFPLELLEKAEGFRKNNPIDLD